MLGCLLSMASGKRFNSHEVSRITVIEGLGGRQVPRKCRVYGEHVGKILVFSVQLLMCGLAPCPSRPCLIKESSCCSGQACLKILRPIHRVDGTLDGHDFRIES